MFNLSNLSNLGNLSNLSGLSGLGYIGNLQQFFYNQNLAANEASTSAKSGWFNGVFSCLVPLWNTIGKGKMKQNTWEIPFDTIRNLEWINSGSQGVVFKVS